jgi:maleylacetoacetate isomerase
MHKTWHAAKVQRVPSFNTFDTKLANISSIFKMSTKQSDFILYTYFRSSCSARLRIALNLKSIPCQHKYINLLKNEQSAADYDVINPSHFVPSLQLLDENRVITQSVAIMEFLEEKYSDKFALLPPQSDLLGRAEVRALVGIISCDTQPVTNLRILSRVDALGGSKAQWARELMGDGLAAYERLAATTAGKYSYGDNVTMADVCLVPAVWGAIRFGVDLNELPIVKRVFEEMSKLDAVVKGHWKNQEDTPVELRG